MNKILFALAVFVPLIFNAQEKAKVSIPKWTSHKPFERKAFIENKGQFENSLPADKQTFNYCIDKGYQVFFYNNEISYRFTKQIKTKETLLSIFESEAKREEREHEYKTETQLINVTWLNANPNAVIEVEDKQSTYYSYVIKNENGQARTVMCSGYSKLIYKNLYDGIDVEYVFHPDNGIEYNLLIHPGADVSNIKMQYTGSGKIFENQSDVHISTIAGDIIDHAPETYYAETKEKINSSFSINNNIISFNLSSYSKDQEIIIDPWTVVPGFTPSNAFDNGVDNTGNILIYGGAVGSFIVEKYGAAGGAPIWTLASSGIDQGYYGDMIVDGAGNFYLSEGFVSGGGHTYKYSPTSSLIWQSTFNSGYQEHWRLALNCVTNKVIVAGGGTTSPTLNIAEIDINTGVLINALNSYPSHEDVAGLCVDALGKSYMVGAISNTIIFTDNANNAVTNIPGGFNLSEIGIGGTPSYYAGNMANGYNIMALGGATFLFTSDGSVIKKWDRNTYALLGSATIPGGQQNLGSGILADNCNNLFVGASNGVYRYDFNLVQKEYQATSAAVYDIAYALNSDIVASGAGFLTPLPFGRESCASDTVIITMVACNPALNTVIVRPTQGTAPFTFLWDDGNTDSVRTNLPLGIHVVTVRDGACSPSFFTDTVNIIPGSGITLTTTHTNVLCNGLNTGSATVTASGGTGPYTINWLPSGGTLTTASNLSAQNYSVSVSDVNACPPTIATFTITEPTVLQQTLTATGPICAPGSSVLSDAIAGGNAPYTVTWSSGGTSVGALVTTTVSPVTTTQYSATVLDANNCSNTVTTTVIVNPPPAVTANSNAPCAGATLNLTSTGGTSWTWSGPLAYTSLSQNPSIANAAVTMNGVYTINVLDINGCAGSATVNVTVNPLPIVTATSGTICIGQQTATLTAGGANTYNWSPATGLSSANGTTVTATPIVTTNYLVTGTDVNGCVNTVNTSVTVNPLPVVIATGTTVCTPSTINLTSSAGGVLYSWSGPLAYSSAAQNPTITNSTTNMSGTYSVTVTDANGCVNGNSTSVTVNPLPNVTASNNTPICFGATLNLTANVGVSWNWNGPLAYTSTQQNPSITNATVNMSGIYTVNVLDINGCAGSAVTTVTVNPLPTITATSGTICIGQQTATLTAGGANTYNWSPATGLSSVSGFSVSANPTVTTNYLITGTDVNGCVNTINTNVTVNPLPVVLATGTTVCTPSTINLTSSAGGVLYSWSGPLAYSSAAQNPTIINSTTNMSGTYSVSVTDVNGCINGNSTLVTVNSLPIVTANSNAPCAGTTLNLTSTGGTGWIWSGPLAYNSVSQNPSITNAAVNMNGVYTVNVLDNNGCAGSATVNVTVNPLPIITATSGTICVTQQTATLTAGGASTYIWFPITGLSSANGTTVTATPVVTTNYLVTGTDVNGCVNTANTSVTVNPLPVVTATGTTVCTPSTINLTSSAGGITYLWSGPLAYSSAAQNPTIINSTTNMSGTYSVTVTDANGCINGNSTSVTVNPLPNVTVSSTAICILKSGTLSAAGANTYAWNPTAGLSSANSPSVTVTIIATTSYTVTGTDMNGCKNTATSTVTVNPLPVLAITPQTTSGCAPLCVSFANTTTSTGNCLWAFGDGTTSTSCTPNHCFKGQGTFGASLTLTDNNGCVNSATASVIVYPVPIADFNASPQPTTILDPTIHFVDATVGAVITTYNWTFGDPNNSSSTLQNPIFVYQSVGSYQAVLMVTSNFGCKDSTLKIIKIDDDFMIYVPNAFSPNADGTNDLFFAKGEGVKDFKLYVFDRWGSQVFFSDDIYKGWDGRFQSKGTEIVQEDVYVWKIECKTSKGEAKLLKGVVSLIK